MLTDIVDYKLEEIRQKQALVSMDALQQRIACARPVRDFTAALTQPGMNLIAEAKYRSPSKGILRGDFDPFALAREYQAAGAQAISVLADSRFFGGAPFVVGAIANDSHIRVPVMYKDFIISEYQIHEARAVGADAVLLIARIVPPEQLRRLRELAQELGMAALVETFDATDIAHALDSGASMIGINNRDLNTFAVDFDRTRGLVQSIPAHITKISESGIASRADMLAMHELGFHAALVGEAIIGAASPTHMISGLLGRE